MAVLTIAAMVQWYGSPLLYKMGGTLKLSILGGVTYPIAKRAFVCTEEFF